MNHSDSLLILLVLCDYLRDALHLAIGVWLVHRTGKSAGLRDLASLVRAMKRRK